MPKITGSKQVSRRLRGLAGQEKVALVGRALFAGGDLIKAEAARSITEGAVSGKFHVPSLPGHPPKEDTGLLRSMIEVHQTGPLRVEVSSNAPYAAVLEYGKHDGSLEERPYMRPATNRKRKEIEALVGKAVSIAVKRK